MAHQIARGAKEFAAQELSDLRAMFDERNEALEECRRELKRKETSVDGRQQLELLNQRVGSLTANNETLKDRIDALVAEKLDLESVNFFL